MKEVNSMKRSEMNAHQKEAFDHICYVMSEDIAAYEMSLEDFEEGSEEYEAVEEYLAQGHDKLAEIVYNDVMATASKGTAKHLRFAGKDQPQPPDQAGFLNQGQESLLTLG